MDGPAGSATIVPIVFPLIAGQVLFTTLLSLRALYSLLDIIIALVLNILIIYIVIKRVNIIEKLLGKGGVYVLRKFFWDYSIGYFCKNVYRQSHQTIIHSFITHDRIFFPYTVIYGICSCVIDFILVIGCRSKSSRPIF